MSAKLFTWLPDFPEILEKEKHIEYLISLLKKLIIPTYSEKYEQWRLYFIYCALSGLKAFQISLELDTKKKVIKFLKRFIKEETDGIIIYSSPFMPFNIPEHFDVVSLYFLSICFHYCEESYLEKQKLKIEAKLKAQPQKMYDLREIYCWCAVFSIYGLEIPEYDKAYISNYIGKLKTYDGAYSFEPNSESHASAVYCVVAIYRILEININHSRLLYWLANRESKFGLSVK